MNQKFEIQTKVEGGKVTRNRSKLSETIAAFEGKNVTISIERTRNKRTNLQNRWYWGVCVPMVQDRLRELGELLSKESTHDLLKMVVMKIDPALIVDEIIIEDTGESIERLKSTTELTTTEFMAYKEHIQQWAIQSLDVDIPDPEEQLTIINQ